MIAVLVEVLALALLLLSGWWILSGSSAPIRMAAALPVGAAQFTVVALLLVVTGLPIAFPWVALLVTVLVAAGVAARRGSLVPTLTPDDRRWLRGGGLLSAAVVAVTALVPLANVTADSFRYLTVARLLAIEGETATVSAFTLETRGLATGAIHGLATFDPGYLRAFGPLVALSGVAVLVLMLRDHLARLDAQQRRWIGLAAAVVMASNHRFVFGAFYINGHMLFAIWLLVVVAVGWYRLQQTTAESGSGLDAREARQRPSGWYVAALLAVAITVLRPEGVLVALLALAPMVVDHRIPVSWRQRLLIATGAGVLVWHAGVLAPRDLLLDRTPPTSTIGLAGLGLVLVLAGVALRFIDVRREWRLLSVGHGLAWAALLVLALENSTLLFRSADVTARNVFSEGGWGGSLILLAGVLVVVVALRRVEHEQLWVFPLATFVPLGALLAYLRDGAYRVGAGDSLNRMLLHVLPLAVFALAATAASSRRARRGQDVTADQ